MRSVASDADRALRSAELQAEDRDADTEEEKKRRGNRGFTQVYPKGWQRIRAMVKQYPAAAELYAFLAENLDPSVGAVVCGQQLLAQELGVTDRTVRRITDWLEKQGAIVRIRVGGGVYAYCLDPKEIWKSWDASKGTAAFYTKTLARKSDNGQVRRRLMTMMGQPEIPGLDEPDDSPTVDEDGVILED